MNLGCRPMYDETTNMSKHVFTLNMSNTRIYSHCCLSDFMEIVSRPLIYKYDLYEKKLRF